MRSDDDSGNGKERFSNVISRLMLRHLRLIRKDLRNDSNANDKF